MTEELVVQMAAAAHHVDAEQLLDSNAFREQVRNLGPNTPGYFQRVADLVRDRATPQQPAAPEPVAELEPQPMPTRYELMAQAAARRAQLTADYSQPITAEDVQLADPAVVNAWARSGKLAHLGVAAKQRRPR
jgi:hypothetical protein